MKKKQEIDDIPYCPVFHPTKTEFQDFQTYLEKVVKGIGSIPIFKVSTLTFITRHVFFDFFSKLQNVRLCVIISDH